MSNLGLWESAYLNRNPFPYGNETSYRLGAEFLKTCRTVEDWGCGAQWFRRVMHSVQPEVRVTGLDGSAGFCDRTVELAEYFPSVPADGIFMRHVLEHDYNWKTILNRALDSFSQRMALIIFTPFSAQQTLLSVYHFPAGGSCPYLSLPSREIAQELQRHDVVYRIESLPSPGTEYGRETIYWIQRPGAKHEQQTSASGSALEFPLVSCLCPTYRRPDLLANSVACYLAQDYPPNRRELIILDDADQFDSHSGDGWEITSLRRRFQSLPAKFNALAGMARGEIFVVWEDDDIYLPWHVSAHVKVLQNGHSFSKPNTIRSHYAGKWQEESAAGRFHGSIAFTRQAYEAVGGWPLTKRGDFDQMLMSRLSELGPIGNPVDGSAPSYVFRWEATEAYHGSGLMRGADDSNWYQLAENLGSTTKQSRLLPQMDSMTRECFAALKLSSSS